MKQKLLDNIQKTFSINEKKELVKWLLSEITEEVCYKDEEFCHSVLEFVCTDEAYYFDNLEHIVGWFEYVIKTYNHVMKVYDNPKE